TARAVTVLYFHRLRCPGLVLDAIEDIRLVNSQAGVFAPATTGMIVLGGGVVKHHTCNANLMRNGANFAVFVNTGQEFDGSDSGARRRRGRQLGQNPAGRAACEGLLGRHAGLPAHPTSCRKMSDSRNPFTQRIKIPLVLAAAAAGTRSRLGRTGRLAASAPTILAAATAMKAGRLCSSRCRPRRAGSWRRNGGSSVNVQQREHGRGHRPRAGQAGRGAERTEEKLDHIEAVQKESQGHINSLSSMFGGVKNWFRGDSAAKKRQQPAQQYEPAPGASLDKAMAVSSTARPGESLP
uniref:DHS-like NAD/FAD-binding domain-containing protein n=1 Tax=Macrostomum lignano TaxID=282301 RepID=A0A1I8FMI2_9PLAT